MQVKPLRNNYITKHSTQTMNIRNLRHKTKEILRKNHIAGFAFNRRKKNYQYSFTSISITFFM